MESLESLGNTLSQVTLYDIKSMYTRAKNVVLNVSEIEAKVQEATNDDPWGASSTLMQEIANRTFNYQDFNEIMPSIYSRFMEKEARQWRQIYKALQLLEYLIKHGSERVVDDARSHIGTIKMLRNFHYIDDKGKDQGINVRNRSRELVELLSDVEQIRVERRKAKANKHKYIGTGNDGLAFSSGNGRYGGFGGDGLGYAGGGSDAFSGGYSGSATYSGGNFASSSSSPAFRDETGRRATTFAEYDAGGDDLTSSSPVTASVSTSRRSNTAPISTRGVTMPAKKNAVTAKQPVVDLLSLDDDAPSASSNNNLFDAIGSTNINKALPPSGAEDDEFADFQAAPPSAAPTAVPSFSAPAPVPAAKPTLMDMLASAPAATTAPLPAAPPMGMGGMRMGAMSHTGIGMPATPTGQHRTIPSMTQAGSPFGGMVPMQPTMNASSAITASPVPMQPHQPQQKSSSKSGPGAFDDLWSMSLTSTPSTTAKPAAKSMKDLQKEKANTGLWGSGTGAVGAAAAPARMGSGVGGAAMGTSMAAKTTGFTGDAGNDDLLL